MISKWNWLQCLMVMLLAFAIVDIVVFSIDADPSLVFSVSPVLGVAALVAGVGRRVPVGGEGSGWWLPMIPLALWMIWFIFVRLFGAFSIPAILFHFRYHLGSNGIATHVALQVIAAISPFLLLAICWTRLARSDRYLQKIGKAAFLPLLLLNPLSVSSASHLFHSYVTTSFPLTERYVDPMLAQPPAGPKKNLVRILLESTERTLWDESGFSDVAAPLKQLEASGFSATGIRQAEMTGWTLAGMVASGCGVPLFNLGAVNRNRFDVVSEFMPGANCLGDVLHRDGYQLAYFKGAELSFSGTDHFLASHKFENAFGFHSLVAKGAGPDNPWGVDDDKVFEAAFRQIETFSKTGRPFNVSLVTLGGHSPEGYISQKCLARAEVMGHANNTLRALACTNQLAKEFVDRLEKAGLLENTVVAIQSDHLAMRNEIYSDLTQRERYNTFILLGAGRTGELTDKMATMMDVNPTLLEALGYELPRHRAGLGVSLLSQETTLAQEYGLETLNDAILSDWALRDRLWALKPEI